MVLMHFNDVTIREAKKLMINEVLSTTSFHWILWSVAFTERHKHFGCGIDYER